MGAILITGGAGMIGKRLTEKLRQKNYNVRILSRSPEKEGEYYWNPAKKEINPKALEEVHTVIHLAGAPVSEKWTKKYKKELYDSRIASADFLFQAIKDSGTSIKTFITASGTNYYGTVTLDKTFAETDPPGTDFLAGLSREWEKAAFRFEDMEARVCAVRTPAVLSDTGGMLGKLIPMAKRRLLSPLGSGRQIVPWVHIDDLCEAYIFLMENEELKGPFNAAAPEVTNNKTFTQKLMKAAGRRILLPAAPAFVLRAILGEMANLLLEGSPVSSQKITDEGFHFQFDTLDKAFTDLVK